MDHQSSVRHRIGGIIPADVVNILAIVGGIVVMIAELVGYILYMMFLSSSYKLL